VIKVSEIIYFLIGLGLGILILAEFEMWFEFSLGQKIEKFISKRKEQNERENNNQIKK
jgi:hypothetical protein